MLARGDAFAAVATTLAAVLRAGAAVTGFATTGGAAVLATGALGAERAGLPGAATGALTVVFPADLVGRLPFTSLTWGTSTSYVNKRNIRRAFSGNFRAL